LGSKDQALSFIQSKDASTLHARLPSAGSLRSFALEGSKRIDNRWSESLERSLHILLVEDSPINQLVATHLLKKHGHNVVVAGNGREALQRLEEHPVDLVLMDVQMPEMDGLQATAAIRAREAGTDRHLPIVALTAQTLPEDRENCRRAGMDWFLSKPVSVQPLLHALRRVMDFSLPQKA
jgi:CheY-like chemotaxis protein